jgi:hypothetical protein
LELEADQNATLEYDAALEKQFAAAEAQVLGSGDGKGTGGTDHGDPTAALSGKSVGSASASSSTGSNSVGSEGDSVDKITE